ncbi:MAG TPA: hypothetical protein VFB71_14385 [Ramlibacter sp.]|nr:hypothetical protein [Ramlibacter sp.]
MGRNIWRWVGAAAAVLAAAGAAAWWWGQGRAPDVSYRTGKIERGLLPAIVLVTHENDIAAWARRRTVFRAGLVIEDKEMGSDSKFRAVPA